MGVNVTAGDGTSPATTNEFMLTDASVWTYGAEVRAGAGFKDNLLLAPSDQEKSALLTSGGDFTAARLPLDGLEFTLFLTLDDTRYLSGQEVDHEDFALGVAQIKVDLNSHWRVGLDARYLFQDQVLDTSVTETNLQPTVVRGHQGALLPSLRRNLPGSCWVELSGLVQRSFFDLPLDDYWEGGPKLTLGRDLANQSVVSVFYGWTLRDYDERSQVSADGMDVPGTALAFHQHDLAAAWRKSWGSQRRWRSALRLGFQANRDNGSGYYDYAKYFAAPQIRYVASAWELKAEVRVSFYDFDRQHVNADDPDLRRKTTTLIGLRGERKLGKQFRLFVDYSYEQSVSNRPSDEYRMNVVSGGGLWGF